MNRHSLDGAGPATSGKRERILEAAVRIFAEKGFYNAKVSEIAREASVADGTIYLYFKSKDDLLISIFEDRMEEVNANARAAVAGDGTPIDRLMRVLRSHLELVQTHPLLAEVLTVELRQSTKFLKEYRQSKFGEFLKLLAQPIEEGQLDGSIRSEVEAPVAARALFGALDELVLAWLLRPRTAARGGGRGRGAVDLSQVAETLGALFIDGLRAAVPGPPQSNPSTGKRRAS